MSGSTFAKIVKEETMGKEAGVLWEMQKGNCGSVCRAAPSMNEIKLSVSRRRGSQ